MRRVGEKWALSATGVDMVTGWGPRAWHGAKPGEAVMSQAWPMVHFRDTHSAPLMHTHLPERHRHTELRGTALKKQTILSLLHVQGHAAGRKHTSFYVCHVLYNVQTDRQNVGWRELLKLGGVGAESKMNIAKSDIHFGR